jgi:hypothetical protein
MKEERKAIRQRVKKAFWDSLSSSKKHKFYDATANQLILADEWGKGTEVDRRAAGLELILANILKAI